MTLSFSPLPCPDSFLRPLDARWKLAGGLILLCGIAVLRSLPVALIGLVVALALASLARMPWRWYLVRISPLVVFLGFFIVSFPLVAHDESPLFQLGGVAVSWSGLRFALVIAAKAVALVTLVLTLLVASPLNQTLSAAHRLGIPGLLIQLTLLTYQYVFLLGSEMRRLRIAVRVRAFRSTMSAHTYRTLAHLSGALLVHSHERAERVAQAMRCRGFDGRFRCLSEFRTRRPDVLFFACTLVAALALVAWDALIR